MKSLKDKQLIELVRNNNTDAEFELYSRYFSHAKRLGKAYHFRYGECGISEDEFTAVCFEATYKAAKSFDLENKSFYAFWLLVVKNAVVDYLHENSYFGRARQLGDISFDEFAYDSQDSDKHEIITKFDDTITLKELKEFIKDNIKISSNGFTKDESLACYYMFILEYDLEELCNITKWSKAKAYKVCQSSRSKLSVIIKNRYFK